VLAGKRGQVATMMNRGDCEIAVPASVGWHPGLAVFTPMARLTRPVVLAWVPGSLLIYKADLAGAPVSLLAELPRPQSPDVREGRIYDSWRLGGRRFRVHRMFRSVARQAEL
jgi:hypothetical protein